MRWDLALRLVMKMVDWEEVALRTPQSAFSRSSSQSAEQLEARLATALAEDRAALASYRLL